MSRTRRDLWFMLLLTSACTILLTSVEALYRRQAAADPVLMRRTLALLPGLADAQTAPPPDADPRAAFERAFDLVMIDGQPGPFAVSRRHPSVMARLEEGASPWGKMVLLVAFDLARGELLGLDVVEHHETPGLGGRIEEERFLAQFRGLPAPDGVRAGKGRHQTRAGEFEAITGATRSSRTVEQIVNTAIARIRQAGGSLPRRRN
ncbi:MAG: FMN-binding protein [Candidatus Riflebacteria bacterium]|nr:FMN-binding protein [Candidatus Riflebacteria bacterium]